MEKRPRVDEERLENIESALDRISCSLAGIYGVLETLCTELLLKKESNNKVAPPSIPAPQFDHDRDK